MIVSRPDYSWSYVPREDRELPPEQRSPFRFRIPEPEEHKWLVDREAERLSSYMDQVIRALLIGWDNLKDEEGGVLEYAEEPVTEPLMGWRRRNMAAPMALIRRMGLLQRQELANAAMAGVPTRMTRADAGN